MDGDRAYVYQIFQRAGLSRGTGQQILFCTPDHKLAEVFASPSAYLPTSIYSAEADTRNAFQEA